MVKGFTTMALNDALTKDLDFVGSTVWKSNKVTLTRPQIVAMLLDFWFAAQEGEGKKTRTPRRHAEEVHDDVDQAASILV